MDTLTWTGYTNFSNNWRRCGKKMQTRKKDIIFSYFSTKRRYPNSVKKETWRLLGINLLFGIVDYTKKYTKLVKVAKSFLFILILNAVSFSIVARSQKPDTDCQTKLWSIFEEQNNMLGDIKITPKWTSSRGSSNVWLKEEKRKRDGDDAETTKGKEKAVQN